MATLNLPVIRMVVADEVRDVLARFGGRLLDRIHGGMVVARADYLSTGEVRVVADRIRGLVDVDLPDRPRLVADALARLADDEERRPVSDGDRLPDPVVGIDEWVARCHAASPLLAVLVEPLDALVTHPHPEVSFARTVHALLADADRLLPGIDAALRPVLEPYAAQTNKEN